MLLPLRIIVAEREHIKRQERRIVAIQRFIWVVHHVGIVATQVLVNAGDNVAAGVQQAASGASGSAIEIDGEEELGIFIRVDHGRIGAGYY